MKTYDCPKCGRRVGMEDINVHDDILLCKSCGETSRFSEIVARERADEESTADAARLSERPPEHLRVVSDPESIDGRMTFVYHRFDRKVLFLIPFTAVWGGISLYGIYGRQFLTHAFDLKISLFGIPFLLGTAVLLSICLFGLFGRRVLELSRGRGRYWWGVGPFGFSRTFAFGRETRIELGHPLISQRGNPAMELQLTPPDGGKTVHVCAGMSEEALVYIRAFLKRSCGAL